MLRHLEVSPQRARSFCRSRVQPELPHLSFPAPERLRRFFLSPDPCLLPRRLLVSSPLNFNAHFVNGRQQALELVAVALAPRSQLLAAPVFCARRLFLLQRRHQPAPEHLEVAGSWAAAMACLSIGRTRRCW